MTQGLLEEARRQLLGEGWTPDQVDAAIDYAERWARGNAIAGAGGDGNLKEVLVQNLLPKGIEQARQWLHRSRARWAEQ